MLKRKVWRKKVLEERQVTNCGSDEKCRNKTLEGAWIWMRMNLKIPRSQIKRKSGAYGTHRWSRGYASGFCRQILRLYEMVSVSSAADLLALLVIWMAAFFDNCVVHNQESVGQLFEAIVCRRFLHLRRDLSLSLMEAGRSVKTQKTNNFCLRW